MIQRQNEREREARLRRIQAVQRVKEAVRWVVSAQIKLLINQVQQPGTNAKLHPVPAVVAVPVTQNPVKTKRPRSIFKADRPVLFIVYIDHTTVPSY